MIIGLEYVITWEGYPDSFIGRLTITTDATYVFESRLETGIIFKSSVEKGSVKIKPYNGGTCDLRKTSPTRTELTRQTV